MQRTNTDTESRWTRLTNGFGRRQASAIVLVALMVLSLPAMSLAGGFDSGTVAAESGLEGQQSFEGQANLEAQLSQTTQSTNNENEIVYAGTRGGEVLALDPDTGDEIWSTPAHSDDVETVVVSPDGETIYSASNDETIKALDAETGVEIWQFDGHSNGVNSIEISSDGETVYSVSTDDTLRAINSETGDEINQWGYSTSVTAVSASPNDGEDIVYTGDWDGNLRAFDAEAENEIWERQPHSSRIIEIDVSASGDDIYTGSSDDTASKIEAESGDEVWKYEDTDWIRTISPSPDGNDVYMGMDVYVRSSDSETDSENWYIDAGASPQSVEPSLSGDSVYAGRTGGSIITIDAETGEIESTFADYLEDGVTTVAVSSQPSDPITGTVRDQHGDPADNATVEAWGVSKPAVDEEDALDLEEDAAELERRAQDLIDETVDPVPGQFESFRDDFADGDHLADVEEFREEIDGTYPLVHAESDWGSGFQFSSSVDDPRVQLDSDSTVVLSAWDPSEDGGWTDPSQVRRSFYGGTAETTFNIYQLGPTGGITDTYEVDAEPFRGEQKVTGGQRIHYAATTDLPPGVYIAHAEGTPGSAQYTFVVGDPEDLFQTWEAELRAEIEDDLEDIEDEIESYSERAENIRDMLGQEHLVRETVQTDENGSFEVSMPRNVVTADVRALKADGDLLETVEDPSMQDLRDYQEDGYNGTFYLPQPHPNTVQPPAEDVDVTVYRSPEVPLGNIESFADLQAFLQEQRLDERIDELRSEYDEQFAEMENRTLERTYQSHRTLVETVPDAEDRYLERSTFEEIQDAEDLNRDQLAEETTHMQIALSGVDRIGPEIDDKDDLIDWIDDRDDLDIDEDNITDADRWLEVEYQLPDSIDTDTLNPEIHWADGTSEPVPEEYWSVESAGALDTSEKLVISGFPVDSTDPAAFDIRVRGASEGSSGIGGIGGDDGGLLDDRVSATNPAFEGSVPDVRSIDVNTLSPGPNERVSMRFRTNGDTAFDSVESVDVFGPDGQSVEAEITGDNSARFSTDGDGKHFIRATVTDNTGGQFVKTFSVRALEQSRADPPTIRAETATGGETFALAGEDLRDAEIVADRGHLKATAVLRADEIPGSVHIKPDAALEGTAHEIDISVVEGQQERQVSTTIETVVHLDSLKAGEDSVIWRDGSGLIRGEPLDFDGSTRYGEILNRGDEDGEKWVIRTYTNDDGTVSLNIDEDPGTLASWEHRLALAVPSISIPFSPLSVIGGLAGSVGTFAIGFVVYRRTNYFG